jgi:hypothetical protein
MSNSKRDRLWSQLTDSAKRLIEENYSSCNLKDLILDEIDDVVSMGISPNSGIIEAGLEKCVEQAKGLAKNTKKTSVTTCRCHLGRVNDGFTTT